MRLWLPRPGSLPGLRFLPDRLAGIRASIHTKLVLGFLGIVALLVALGAVGLSALESADRRASELVHLERRIAAYRQLQHNVTGQLYVAATAFLADTEAEVSALSRRLTQFEYDFDRAELVAQDDLALLRGIRADYEELIGTCFTIIATVRKRAFVIARATHDNHAVPLANRLKRHIYTLVNKAESDMVENAALSTAAYRTSQITLLAGSIVAVILALVLGYSLSTSLTEPVRAIRARLRSIATGDFNGELEVRNRDELGDLAENVNRMSRRLHRLYGELETANRHKSTFLANMSHELRTPMNAIIGFNRLVMRRCKHILPEKQYDNLGKIAISAEQLLSLINTVLDLSKIEAGRIEVQPTEFELRSLLDSCVRTAEPLIDGKPIDLVSESDEVLPMMYTDREKVQQIVLNLLSNAAKFTDRGRIVLAAGVHDDAVRISVTDTGIGISDDQLPTIFDEFTQVDSTTTRAHAGTGLGLAISRRLVTLLRGTIEVESEYGVGSTFHVSVPVRYRAPLVSHGQRMAPPSGEERKAS